MSTASARPGSIKAAVIHLNDASGAKDWQRKHVDDGFKRQTFCGERHLSSAGSTFEKTVHGHCAEVFIRECALRNVRVEKHSAMQHQWRKL